MIKKVVKKTSSKQKNNKQSDKKESVAKQALNVVTRTFAKAFGKLAPAPKKVAPEKKQTPAPIVATKTAAAPAPIKSSKSAPKSAGKTKKAQSKAAGEPTEQADVVKDEIFNTILEKGKKIGALSYEEIIEFRQRYHLSDKETAELMRHLSQEGVELLMQEEVDDSYLTDLQKEEAPAQAAAAPQFTSEIELDVEESEADEDEDEEEEEEAEDEEEDEAEEPKVGNVFGYAPPDPKKKGKKLASIDVTVQKVYPSKKTADVKSLTSKTVYKGVPFSELTSDD